MQVLQQQFSVSYSFPVIFAEDVFDLQNPLLADVMRQGGHALPDTITLLRSALQHLDPS